MSHRYIFLKCIFISLFFCDLSFAHEIWIKTKGGGSFLLEVEAEETLASLQSHVARVAGGKESDYFIQVSDKKFLNIEAISQGGYLGRPREYQSLLSGGEASDVHYIITFLANRSLVAITRAKNELEKAGDRIDHIHPLRFLLEVFLNEELKVGIRNIRGRGWVWNHFIGGLKNSLTTEAYYGNIKEEYLRHFADALELDIAHIRPLINIQNWDQFIDLLITHIPRKGDHDRYDF